jgi:hypothetical protein
MVPFNTAHQVGGILVVATFFQAILGCIHHKDFNKARRRAWANYAHLWTGVMVILVGMVNTTLYVIPLSCVPLKNLPQLLKLEVRSRILLTCCIGASSLSDQWRRD